MITVNKMRFILEENMTKAQSFFGGTNPKDKATKSKHISDTGNASGGGINIQRRTKVKQVGTHHGSPGNSQQVRDSKWSTKEVNGRPSLVGKEDNRTSWK